MGYGGAHSLMCGVVYKGLILPIQTLLRVPEANLILEQVGYGNPYGTPKAPGHRAKLKAKDLFPPPPPPHESKDLLEVGLEDDI